MLRPATPLTLLLLAAFVLLLISVISTPIVKNIPLASFAGVDYGVFGFCDRGVCSGVEVGYDIAKSPFTASQSKNFDLPNSTRTTLTAILIIHPIAALFTLVMLILAATAHFHAPSHSPRYLLGVFILSILTLILALLAFLIDVLIFIPHMAWGSYIVLAATILIAMSGIVSCAMRRTLVSRKARKRRIEENAEMNGENFYNRQGTTAPPVVPKVDDNMMNGALGVDKLPTFATFESQKPDEGRTSDERIPLTTRTTNETLTGSNSAGRGMGYRNPTPPRDQYGNPIHGLTPAPQGMRNRDPNMDPSLSRQYSDTSMSSSRAGMPYRGRGGYPPGRGVYGPPPNGRGGYRGGYGNPTGRGGYGPPGPPGPPPGPYQGPFAGPNDGMMAGAMGGMAAGSMRAGRGVPPPRYGRGGYERGVSPVGSYNQYAGGPAPQDDPYGRNASPRPPPVGEYTAYNPEEVDSFPRAESPPPLPSSEHQEPVGQAVEMDASTGSPSHPPTDFGTQYGQLRDSDGDITGMVGLQQQRQNPPLNRDTFTTDGSRYSGDESFVPARQGWTEAGSSLNPASQPAELPPVSPVSQKRQSASDIYYEDVDPRFAQQPPSGPSPIPGVPLINTPQDNLHPLPHNPHDGIRAASRSPVGSDRSGYTSASGRRSNPRWAGQAGPGRRPGDAPRADVLTSNPDFELPGSRSSPARGLAPGQTAGAGMVPGSAYPGSGL